MFLTTVEIEDLTGETTPVKQRHVLTRNGIGFVLRSDGAIRVTWAVVNACLVAKAAQSDVPNREVRADKAPNFDALLRGAASANYRHRKFSENL